MYLHEAVGKFKKFRMSDWLPAIYYFVDDRGRLIFHTWSGEEQEARPNLKEMCADNWEEYREPAPGVFPTHTDVSDVEIGIVLAKIEYAKASVNTEKMQEIWTPIFNAPDLSLKRHLEEIAKVCAYGRKSDHWGAIGQRPIHTISGYIEQTGRRITSDSQFEIQYDSEKWMLRVTGHTHGDIPMWVSKFRVVVPSPPVKWVTKEADFVQWARCFYDGLGNVTSRNAEFNIPDGGEIIKCTYKIPEGKRHV